MDAKILRSKSVHFYLHVRGSIVLTDMVGMQLSDVGAAAKVARQMLATYCARQSVDTSHAYVEITDEAGHALELVRLAQGEAKAVSRTAPHP
jgi:hypothetical protein